MTLWPSSRARCPAIYASALRMGYEWAARGYIAFRCAQEDDPLPLTQLLVHSTCGAALRAIQVQYVLESGCASNHTATYITHGSPDTIPRARTHTRAHTQTHTHTPDNLSIDAVPAAPPGHWAAHT